MYVRLAGKISHSYGITCQPAMQPDAQKELMKAILKIVFRVRHLVNSVQDLALALNVLLIIVGNSCLMANV